MSKQILISLLLLLFNISVFAQSEQYAAPVKWESYKLADKEVSVLFPKLPVALQFTDECNEIEYSIYYAYAEEVVYFMRIYSKTKSKPPKFCKIKGKFGENSLKSRITELKNSSKNIKSSETIQNSRNVLKLENESSTDLIFDDLENNRWFEFSAVYRKNAEINPKVFFDSINIGKNLIGNEIKEGAKSLIGDAQSAKEGVSGENNPLNDVNKSLVIVTTPRPNYTDAARQNNVQGQVTLRVTFLANGGIGSVSVVSALGYGLTEKAIAAARKIAFLPPKRNGVNYSVTKSVQFSFSIY